jgi:hypothetical protein
MSAQLVFAAALIGLGLIATGPPARAAETEAHLNGAAELRAAALVEEHKHPVVAERFERLWNKSLWLVGCGAGFGRGSPHLIPEDTIQHADDDTHRLIEWAQLQGLREWSELSAAGTWITAPGGYAGAANPVRVNPISCERTANELHAGVVALPVGVP